MNKAHIHATITLLVAREELFFYSINFLVSAKTALADFVRCSFTNIRSERLAASFEPEVSPASSSLWTEQVRVDEQLLARWFEPWQLAMAKASLRSFQLAKMAGVALTRIVYAQLFHVVYDSTSIRSPHIRLRGHNIWIYLININYANVEIDTVSWTSLELLRQVLRNCGVNCYAESTTNTKRKRYMH